MSIYANYGEIDLPNPMLKSKIKTNLPQKTIEIKTCHFTMLLAILPLLSTKTIIIQTHNKRKVYKCAQIPRFYGNDMHAPTVVPKLFLSSGNGLGKRLIACLPVILTSVSRVFIMSLTLT